MATKAPCPREIREAETNSTKVLEAGETSQSRGIEAPEGPPEISEGHESLEQQESDHAHAESAFASSSM